MLHSCTNYECYKGLYSSMNSYNLFEITHSLLRQFSPENWTLYKGKHLLSFVDNHDVTRVASILQNPAHLPLIYALLFGMPGIPCIYYGSEWGAEGKKQDGDDALRPSFEQPIENDPDRPYHRNGEGAPRKPRALLRRLQAACAHQQAVHLGARDRRRTSARCRKYRRAAVPRTL